MAEQHIGIIGGGFAGTQAARAARRVAPDAVINVIDQTGVATMVPALPDVLSGRVRRSMLTRPLTEVLGQGIGVIRDSVIQVDTDRQTAFGRAGTYRFDALVVVPGSVPAAYPESWREVTVHTVHSLESAMRLRREVERTAVENGRVRVVIVGAGYTGLETAVALHDGLERWVVPDITVVDAAERILPMVTPGEQERMEQYLVGRGIDLCLATTVDTVTTREVILSDGREVASPILVWAAGMRAAPVEMTPAVERTRDGRVVVADDLTVPGTEGVFAAGDFAALHDRDAVLRRAVNFAYYSGRRAGRNAGAYLRKRSLRPFRPVDLGWVIPLGTTSVGRVLGKIPMGGRFGVRAHYLMSGFRHFGGGRSGEFYRTALRIVRRPDPPSGAAAKEDERGGEA